MLKLTRFRQPVTWLSMKLITQLTNQLFNKDIKRYFYRNTEEQIYPSDIASILNSIPLDNAISTFSTFALPKKLRIFPFLERFNQKDFFHSLPAGQKSILLNSLVSTDRISFLSSLKDLEFTTVAKFLNEKNFKESERLLTYPKDSVLRLINTDFITLNSSMSIEEAIRYLQEHQPDNENANVVYVVDERGKLVDDMPIRKLILYPDSRQLHEIMDYNCIALGVNDTTGDAADTFKKYDRVSLPVVGPDGAIIGIVTVDDVMDATEEEDTRDMQMFGGMESLEFPYVKTPLLQLVQKRAGWLVILFLSEMLTATAMGYFEGEIAKAVVLALFVPLVISSGGNSGSQAATLIIRAMAVRELTVRDWWYVMRREIQSGILLGLTLGLLGFARISIWQYLGWYNYGEHWLLMALTVLFSLIGIVLWGTFSGSMIPIILKRVKLDPATSSAPFVATLVDVTGLVIYFSIAAVILRGTLL